jgi:nucleoside-diphosphate-sugar epimerase
MAVVAVTGATGFIGTRLTRALTEAGYGVRALTRRVPPQSDSDVVWVTGSLADDRALAALVKEADAVVHCGGAIKALSRAHFLEINSAGTRRLAAAAAAEKKPPQFIYLSSLAARQPLLSSYAASKRAGEQVLRGFDILRPVILRSPAVYGPGDMETLRIFQMAANGFVLAPGGRANRTSLAHVDDVARAVIAALKLGHGSERPIEFDDGRSRGYSWDEIAAAAGSALRLTPKVIALPAPLVYAAGAAGSLHGAFTRRPNVLCWDKVAELLHSDWVSAPSALPGYNPLWDIEKGFKDTVSWYTSRGLLKSNG